MKLTLTDSRSQKTNFLTYSVHSSAVYVRTVSWHREEISVDLESQSGSAVNPGEGAEEELQSTDAWISRLRNALLSIEGIESMHLAIDDNTIDVWVIIPKRDVDLVRKVSETERTVMSQLINRQPDASFHFDFHTVYRESQKVSDLIPGRAIKIPALT